MGVTATVTPFATTYWTCAGTTVASPGNYGDRQGIVEDSDGDGIVRWELGRQSMRTGLFTMIDGASGSITTRSNRSTQFVEITFPAKSFLRDESGAFSRFAMNIANLGRTSVPIFWVRPGVGAWSGDASDSSGLVDELPATQGKSLLDVRTMKPVGSSPAAPSGVQPGDHVILQDSRGEFWSGGLVDSRLSEASGGGVILFARNAGTEDTKKITVTLARIDGTDGTVSVNYETVDVSVTAGLDYQASAGTATFLPGQIFSSIEVPVIDNDVAKAGTFKLNLSAPSGATLGVSSIELYLADNDGTPAVYLSNVTVSEEGDSGSKEVSYSVPLGHTAPQPVTLQWEIRNRFNDEVLETGILEYGLREKEKTITAHYVADDIWGSTRLWRVRVTNAVNAVVSQTGGFLTIEDDDPPPTMTVPNVTVSESAGNATLTVHLSAPVYHDFFGGFRTENGSATWPADFDDPSTGVLYTAGSDTATITIPIHNDTLVEGTETFEVWVFNFDPGDYPAATVTILDDDGPPKRRTVRH